MTRLVLLVDTKCGPCSELGKQARALSGGRLEVAGLDDPGWRGLVDAHEPVIIEPATGRRWRRARLLAKLAAVVGPANALALLRLAGAQADGGAGPQADGRGPLRGGLAVARGVIAGRPASRVRSAETGR